MPRRPSTKPKKASTARNRPAVVVLGSDCTLREAGALKKQLLAPKAAFGITLDARGVERIDAAGLQLLAALALREVSMNRCLRWSGISDELVATARRAGLLEVLELDAVMETAA